MNRSRDGVKKGSLTDEPLLLGHITQTHLKSRLVKIRSLVAQPIFPTKDEPNNTPDSQSLNNRPSANHRIPFVDPTPALIEGGHVLIGSKHHAANVSQLIALGVTAVLNCASGGISRLPLDELEENGIRYAFTNCRMDHFDYPILHATTTSRGSNSSIIYGGPKGEPGTASQHLIVAKELYQEVKKEKGKVLFFCVAGQNRSAVLSIAVMMLDGHRLDDILESCAKLRPFVLENVGFQRQIVELEGMLAHEAKQKASEAMDGFDDRAHYHHGQRPVLLNSPSGRHHLERSVSEIELEKQLVEIELLIPGLCTMDVKIPIRCTIADVKSALVKHANDYFLAHYYGGAQDAKTSNRTESVVRIAKSWIVLAMFGYDDMYDVPLEVEAMDRSVQIERMRSMFNLQVSCDAAGETMVTWTGKCRFALVIVSVATTGSNQHTPEKQTSWTFKHEERPGAPATFLENTLKGTHLRVWDFVSGQAFCTPEPIVFSYSEDGPSDKRLGFRLGQAFCTPEPIVFSYSEDGPSDKRSFMKVSTCVNRVQHFQSPGEVLEGNSDDPSGYILGMGSNAIVHRTYLVPTSAKPATITNADAISISERSPPTNPRTDKLKRNHSLSLKSNSTQSRDAAVKRSFTLSKMLASLDNSSEAGLAKRLRFANSLNSDGRIAQFYGLGIALSSNIANHETYKFELVLVSRYEEDFSTRTMKRFLDDYVANLSSTSALTSTSTTNTPATKTGLSKTQQQEMQQLQQNFTLIDVKIFLVSLLNAFRDLTLMGVQAFDFSYMNVLVSRDYKSVRLIDIDGNSKGSIQFPSEYISGTKFAQNLHKPCLEVDLNQVLPMVLMEFILGKGWGKGFAATKKSEIWWAGDNHEKAKAIIKQVLLENFYSSTSTQTQTTNDEVMK
eukprot:CAMPEP_0194393786 /NCGR_PEP_ID=MMETSP0174-20130528/123489_1 /TAXON_ID=216777 /ORGANISM="Proboscia alata, Strain PI-D3" /LENGTH=896 /DNA_ID=CAMNT_0039189505 /DNA_START=210 /DNA_END=2901 /DNA_ORIENTATION=+